MYFDLEKTPAKKAAFNKKSNAKFGWLDTLPWGIFGIDASDGISYQEIINLQNAVGSDADGLVGMSTLKQVQQSLRIHKQVIWNPVTGLVADVGSTQCDFMYWNGIEIPLPDCEYPIYTYADHEGIDLHAAGSFSKRHREIKQIVVHWGGLNPHHLGRVFSNRKASSHIAIGRSEITGEVGIYQYLDLAHVAWHAVGANNNSIGIDICQQPELKHLGYYVGKGYNVETVTNPAKGYGPSKIISLDPEIRSATSSVIYALRSAFDISEYTPPVEAKVVDKSDFEDGGVFSHFHVDYKGQGKWDVAPWWDSILSDLENRC